MPPFDHDRYASLVRADRLGRVVRYVEETTSTMNDARAGADQDREASVGAAYVGGRQTAGRGRQGRPWVSEPGAGLYVTYHLVPAVAAPDVPLLAAAGALAVADAAADLAELRTAIKWPNDVLVDGRKLAGVLAEARHGARLDVFLGIGVNLREAALPPEVRAIATSFEAVTGTAPNIEEALAAVSASLERRCEQLERSPRSFVDGWRGRLETLGQQVRFALSDGRMVEGLAVDVGPTGELVLQRATGECTSYAAGEVTTIR